MSEELLLTITPHEDGKHCTGCERLHNGCEWQMIGKDWWPERGPSCLAASRAARELREENARLREAAIKVSRWDDHHPYCNGVSGPGRCVCGLDDIRAALKEGR